MRAKEERSRDARMMKFIVRLTDTSSCKPGLYSNHEYFMFILSVVTPILAIFNIHLLPTAFKTIRDNTNNILVLLLEIGPGVKKVHTSSRFSPRGGVSDY